MEHRQRHRTSGRLRTALRRRLGRHARRVLNDSGASMTLEWAMLLAVVGLPSYVVIRLALDTLVGHYQMMTMLNSLPFP